MDKIYYTFDDYICDVEAIGALVEHTNFKPDIIVGILRGGAIPAVQLSHMLNKPVHSFSLSLRDNKVVDESVFSRLMEIINSGNKVLFVDDINDSGETFKQILLHLTRYDVKSNMYKFASLVYIKNSEIQSDYYGMVIEKVNDQPWVQFWWENDRA